MRGFIGTVDRSCGESAPFNTIFGDPVYVALGVNEGGVIVSGGATVTDVTGFYTSKLRAMGSSRVGADRISLDGPRARSFSMFTCCFSRVVVATLGCRRRMGRGEGGKTGVSSGRGALVSRLLCFANVIGGRDILISCSCLGSLLGRCGSGSVEDLGTFCC